MLTMNDIRGLNKVFYASLVQTGPWVKYMVAVFAEYN